jgi:hypothetical protein
MYDILFQLVNQESSPDNEPDAQVIESCRVKTSVSVVMLKKMGPDTWLLAGAHYIPSFCGCRHSSQTVLVAACEHMFCFPCCSLTNRAGCSPASSGVK